MPMLLSHAPATVISSTQHGAPQYSISPQKISPSHFFCSRGIRSSRHTACRRRPASKIIASLTITLITVAIRNKCHAEARPTASGRRSPALTVTSRWPRDDADSSGRLATAMRRAMPSAASWPRFMLAISRHADSPADTSRARDDFLLASTSYHDSKLPSFDAQARFRSARYMLADESGARASRCVKAAIAVDGNGPAGTRAARPGCVELAPPPTLDTCRDVTEVRPPTVIRAYRLLRGPRQSGWRAFFLPSRRSNAGEFSLVRRYRRSLSIHAMSKAAWSARSHAD